MKFVLRKLTYSIWISCQERLFQGYWQTQFSCLHKIKYITNFKIIILLKSLSKPNKSFCISTSGLTLDQINDINGHNPEVKENTPDVEPQTVQNGTQILLSSQDTSEQNPKHWQNHLELARKMLSTAGLVLLHPLLHSSTAIRTQSSSSSPQDRCLQPYFFFPQRTERGSLSSC